MMMVVVVLVVGAIEGKSALVQEMAGCRQAQNIRGLFSSSLALSI